MQAMASTNDFDSDWKNITFLKWKEVQCLENAFRLILGFIWKLTYNILIFSYLGGCGTPSTISNSGITENQISTSNPQKRQILDGDMSNDSKRQRVETVKVESNTVVSKIPQCPGHNQKCKMSQVRNKGDNYSRWFFMCSLPRSKQCKFFKVRVDIFCLILKVKSALFWGDVQESF